MKLILKKDWRGPVKVMFAGTYRIPQDISLAHAKCARADGAGEIDRGVTVATADPFPPEHKEQKATPPNEVTKPAGGKGRPSAS